MCYGSITSRPQQTAPVTAPAPALTAVNDRLAAAQAETGFKLGQQVDGHLFDLINGKVIGFARVDENGLNGVRKVVVSHTVFTPEGQSVRQNLYAPSEIFAV